MLEKQRRRNKPQFLIGIDEVGRGPIAGPVAVGTFCILMKNLGQVRKIFRGVKESKQLSEQKREERFVVIQQAQKAGLIDFAVSFQSEKVIDGNGLSFAIKRALGDSLFAVVNNCSSLDIEIMSTGNYSAKKISKNAALNLNDFKVLLDGGLKAPPEFINQKTIIKGDEKELVIALASICAKVLRDRKMNALSKKHPNYGFEKHKGYGTKSHYEAIKKYGILSVHRKLFLGNFLAH